jgi:aliphatic sulfonates family ABC transporter substrate-binding protein
MLFAKVAGGARLMRRRQFLTFTLAAAFAAGLFAVLPVRADAPKEFRIGYQKNGVLLVAKEQKLIEKRLQPLGISVRWIEFSSGPPLLEALNSGNIDYGATGDAPPIFAQAARANLLYVAAMPAGGSAAAILVKSGSSIHSLGDLKGKKVGFAQASSAHNVTVAALEKAGLSYSEITPVYLQPADAAAAFARGALDAWSIWDPYFAIAERQPGTQVLALAGDIVTQNSYFLANRDFTAKFPEIVGAVNDELLRATAWTNDHRDEAAKLFADATGIDLPIMNTVVARSTFVFAPLSDQVVAEQQSIADRFKELGLIPATVSVRDITWKWVPNS